MQGLASKIYDKYEEEKAELLKKLDSKLKAELMLAEHGLMEEQSNVSVMYHDHSNTISFNWKAFSTCGEEMTKDFVQKVWKELPISESPEDNYKITFAGKEPILTDSPLVLKYKIKESLVKIYYKSSTGYCIDIQVPFSWFKEYTFERPFVQKGSFGHEVKRWTETEVQCFYTQRYAGGYRTTYFLEGAEHVEEFENFCLTGSFKYQDELQDK
jgi:hypothetical protein